MRHKQGIKILKVKWALLTNNRSLLPRLPIKAEFESLLTDFHKVEQIPYNSDSDAKLLIVEQPEMQAALHTVGGMTIATGNFSQLTKQARDLRYSFFGNEGLVFRQTLKLLEDKYDIFSFHACAMYQPGRRRLFLVVGSAGAGKSCFILKGLEMGLQVFSVEMGHFKIRGDRLGFYKGALVDNIRIGNLKHNYPFILEKLNIRLGRIANEWVKKIPLELHQFQTRADSLVNPDVVIILPRVEQGRKSYFCQQENDRRKISRILFENASEKIGQSMLLYESLPFVCLDSPRAARRRAEAVKTLLSHKSLKKIVSIVSGPEDCWKNLISQNEGDKMV